MRERELLIPILILCAVGGLIALALLPSESSSDSRLSECQSVYFDQVKALLAASP